MNKQICGVLGDDLRWMFVYLPTCGSKIEFAENSIYSALTAVHVTHCYLNVRVAAFEFIYPITRQLPVDFPQGSKQNSIFEKVKWRCRVETFICVTKFHEGKIRCWLTKRYSKIYGNCYIRLRECLIDNGSEIWYEWWSEIWMWKTFISRLFRHILLQHRTMNNIMIKIKH